MPPTADQPRKTRSTRLLATGDEEPAVRLWGRAAGRRAGTAFTLPEAIGGLALASEGLAVAFGTDLAVLVPRRDG